MNWTQVGTVGTLIYRESVKGTDDNLDLLLESEADIGGRLWD